MEYVRVGSLFISISKGKEIAPRGVQCDTVNKSIVAKRRSILKAILMLMEMKSFTTTLDSEVDVDNNSTYWDQITSPKTCKVVVTSMTENFHHGIRALSRNSRNLRIPLFIGREKVLDIAARK